MCIRDRPRPGDSIVAVARNPERIIDEEALEAELATPEGELTVVGGALAGVEGEGASNAEASAPHTDTAAGADGDRQDAVPSEEGDASGTSPDETGGRE